MIDSNEYTTLDAFLADNAAGYTILHQARALYSDDQNEYDDATAAMAERFEHFLREVTARLGEADKQAREWEVGIPTFASGNGYALWNRGENFISLFINWDNPEDPAFVIVARAPITSFDDDPGASNPWASQWMEKGEW